MNEGDHNVPFYFRIPLPGPFRYSVRLSGRKRCQRAALARRPAPAPKAANRRIEMLMLLDTPGVSSEDRLELLEVQA